MKKTLFAKTIALMACLLCWMSAAAQEAYANYTPEDSTLTFYFDDLRSSRTGTTYDLNANLEMGQYYPDWTMNRTDHVVFDASFADARPTSTYGWFGDMNHLKSIDGISYLNTDSVTDMSSMFQQCASLTRLDVSHFNTAKVIDMNNMFSGCRSLESLDVSHFDTGNVIDMSSMFSACRSLDSLDVSHFDTGNVIDMSNMFYYCMGLTSIDVSNFNTENVIDMGGMFQNCRVLTSIDVSHFDTGSVTNMYGLFYNCYALTSIDVSHFNTRNVKNMSCMFDGCYSLTSIDMTNFNTANVTTMRSMFADCRSLTSLDVSHFDTRSVTNMHSMFYYCVGLTSIDVSHFDTKRVTSMHGMFYSCVRLTSIDVSNFNTANVTDMGFMFSYCRALQSIDVSNFNTSKATDMSVMFQECVGLTSIDVSNFDTSNATDISSMFNGCYGLTSIDVSNFNTKKVTDMGGLFSRCSGLTSINLKNFNTSNVTVMSSMFFNCTRLTTVYVGDKWSTIDVFESENMFAYCYSLVGGRGTTFDPDHIDKAYAHIDRGPRNPGYFSAPPKIPGDVNEDDAVDIADINAVIDVIQGRADYARADVNGDGEVNIADVNAIIRIIQGDDTPTPNDHEWVDLGLPSGTLWATMNVGASAPEGYGDYFAWGETAAKTEYVWDNYKWIDSDNGYQLAKYNTDSNCGPVDDKTELEPEDDAATVNWGASWRMPSLDQQQELVDHCTWTKTTVNGVDGHLITGPNGNTMFLPASGARFESTLNFAGTYGFYWSRTLDALSPPIAYCLYFSLGNTHFCSNYYARYNGFVVRAVRAAGN